MARKIIEEETYEMIDMFDSSIVNVKMGSDAHTPYFLVEVSESAGGYVADHKFCKIFFNGSGAIVRAYSADGETWTYDSNHAGSLSVGAVQLSDFYTDNGAAADGLAPSQHALYSGLATKIGTDMISDAYESSSTALIGQVASSYAVRKAYEEATTVKTPSVTWATDGGIHTSGNTVRRTGNVVEVNTVLQTSSNNNGNVITGLPKPASDGFYMTIVPYDGSTPFGFQLTVAGTLKRSGTNATAGKECDIHFTYITSD